MKTKNLLLSGMVLFCLLLTTVATGQSLVDDVDITKEEAKINLSDETPRSYLLEIGGPDGYYYRKQIDAVSDVILPNVSADGEKFADGLYSLQVTPVYSLTDGQKAELNKMREANDQEAIAAYREKHGLPEHIRNFAVNFSIRSGQFVTPEKKEAGLQIPTMSSKWDMNHPALYASITTEAVDYNNFATDNTQMEDDQVFLDDVIVDGSICVGQDCVNGENFGFDTGRYKENNLRVHFDDTSNSASFPSNDWRITVNDSSNGGASYFAIEDATAGRQIFRVDAGAPANSLRVDSNGDVSIGNSNAVVELHITDGDSPTMRLEQDGSSGFTQQTWDMVGNETNFFIRDVTNGSLLPFRIRPRAPKNSLYIDAEGDIGLGTENPGTNALQVESGDVYVKSGNLGINKVPTVALDVVGNTKVVGNQVVVGNTTLLGDLDVYMQSNITYYYDDGNTLNRVFFISANQQRVGIGTNAPVHQLQLSMDDAAKPNGGDWTAASDRRLKTNIEDFHGGLEEIMKIRPVSYNYNGKLGMQTDKRFVGVIAQEMKEIAPYTVGRLKAEAPEGEEPYLSYDGTPVTYMLINAVQEQQEIIDAQQQEIDALKGQLAEVEEMKASLSALTQLVNEKLAASVSGDEDANASTGEKE